MRNSVVVSIHPQYVGSILNGNKPLELKDLGLTRAPQNYQYVGVDIYE